MKNLFRSLAVVLALFVATPLVAQTVLTTTTTGAAIADGGVTAVTVAATTGITAPGTGATQVYLLIDKELLTVRNINGLVVGVVRGQQGTRATPHVTASIVTVVPVGSVINYVPNGQCLRTNLTTVPTIVGGTGSGVQFFAGSQWDCLGVTTAGMWVMTSDNGTGVLGSTMASTAGTLGAFTGTILTVSGALAVTGFTNPAGVQPGWRVSIVPSGTFTWTAANNIILAGTAVVGKLLEFVWNGAKWVPSYIA
jgi:hypothetical protein